MKGTLIGCSILVTLSALLWWGAHNPPPVHDEHEHHHSHDHDEPYTLSQEAMNAAQIDLRTAEAKTLHVTLKKGGFIQVHPDKLAHITSPFEAKADKVFHKVGDKVEKGAILAELYSPKISELRNNYTQALQNEEKAFTEFEREEALFRLGLASKQTINEKSYSWQLAKTQTELAKQLIGNLGEKGETFSITAPFKGTVVERHLTHGEWVDPKETLFVLADLTQLWVEFPLFPSEMDIAKNHSEIFINKEPAKLITIIPSLERDLALKGIAHLENDQEEFHPGTYANIELVVNTKEVKIGVERQAIQTMDGRPYIFVKKGDEIEPRLVELGDEDDDFVEVIAGLDKDEVYASKNAFRIKADLGKEDVEHDHD